MIADLEKTLDLREHSISETVMITVEVLILRKASHLRDQCREGVRVAMAADLHMEDLAAAAHMEAAHRAAMEEASEADSAVETVADSEAAHEAAMAEDEDEAGDEKKASTLLCSSTEPLIDLRAKLLQPIFIRSRIHSWTLSSTIESSDRSWSRAM